MIVGLLRRSEHDLCGISDNAASGKVGEIIAVTVPSASSVSLTSGTPANIASISLTPGDWDVRANIVTNPNASTTTSLVLSWIGITSATVPAPPNGGANTLNSDGGFTRARITDNTIGQGISLNSVGDSIRLDHNTYIGSSAQDAVFVNLIANAGNLQAIGENCSQNGSCIHIECAASFVIAVGEYEHANTGNSTPLINLGGEVCPLGGGIVFGNQMQALPGTGGTPLLINVNNANGVLIDGNTIRTPSNYTPVSVGSAATNTVIGAGNNWGSTTTHVSNSNSSTLKVSAGLCESSC
jgi:hypothetical protein